MANYFNFEAKRTALAPVIGAMVIGYESMSALVLSDNVEISAILNDYMRLEPSDLVTTKTQALISKCVQERDEKKIKAIKRKDALEAQIENQPAGATAKQAEIVAKLETAIAQYEAAVKIEYIPVLTYTPLTYSVALEKVGEIIKKVPRRGLIIGIVPRSISLLFQGDSDANKSFETQLRKSDFATQYQPEKPWADVLNIIRLWSKNNSQQILDIAIHKYVMSAGDCNTMLARIQNYNEMNRKGRRTFGESNSKILTKIMGTCSYVNPLSTIQTQTLDVFIQDNFKPNPKARYWGFDPKLRMRVNTMTEDETLAMRDEVKDFILNNYSKDARQQMESIYHDFLIKPKMELREVTSAKHVFPVAVKLPRTFVTGFGPIRGAMQTLEAPYSKDLKNMFELNRQQNKTAPSVLGTTFNSDGLIKILNYLLGNEATTKAIDKDEVLSWTYVCPDRKRMEMTLSLELKLFYTFSLTYYYLAAKMKDYARCCTRIADWESKPKFITFQAGNIARLKMSPSVLASGTHGTSLKDDIDNNYHLSCVNLILTGVLDSGDYKLITYNEVNTKKELEKVKMDMRHYFRYITGGDDGWMVLKEKDYDLIISTMKAYANMVGIEWTDLGRRKMLMLDEENFIKFLDGEAATTVDDDVVQYDTVHLNDKHTIFYGFVMVCKCVNGKIEEAFPMYDVPKMVSSLWHPNSTPPKFEFEGKVFKMSAQVYKLVRCIGINLVVGMFKPINTLIKMIFDDIKGTSVLPLNFDMKEIIVNAGIPVGIDPDSLPRLDSFRVHNPEEVLYIYGVGPQPNSDLDGNQEMAVLEEDEVTDSFMSRWGDLLDDLEDETPTNLPNVKEKVADKIHRMDDIRAQLKEMVVAKRSDGNAKQIVAALYHPTSSSYFKPFSKEPWYKEYKRLSTDERVAVCENVLDYFVKSNVAIRKVPFNDPEEEFSFFYEYDGQEYKIVSDADTPGYFDMIDVLREKFPKIEKAAIIVSVTHSSDGPSTQVLVPDYLASLQFIANQ